ncbi:uncharacterized protein BHQ10_002613 [Talaromyces amestolkiae]|uniref:Rhodopsin domain-containing protein n=1 Tax=Talaromyces amestolkiae TaxID=1196081 RepID=A0A364KSW8_TALAM|nr:uncharacterized protein BHQ10_002613 [Talaromyces amestolkiae]RAO66601.1 hypothetical protein BHQ10_002613 [Talaromyces amestolkiae]
MAPTPDQGWKIYVGTLTTIVPATLAVGARFLARWIGGIRYWWDDWMVLIALIDCWAMTGLRLTAVKYFGHGKHAADLPEETVIKFDKSFIAVQMLYFVDVVATKAAFLFLYYRIFGVNVWFRRALYFLAFLLVAFLIACPIVAVAGCHPVSYYWNKNQLGSCINEVEFYRGNGIANVILDFIIFCLPVPMVLRLKTTVRQKLLISGIFVLGFFVCVISIIRIVAFNGSNPTDMTWSTVETAMWSSIEQAVSIICTCLPTLRPLFSRFHRSTTSSSEQSNNYPTEPRGKTSSNNITLSQFTNSGEGDSTAEFARLSDHYDNDGDDVDDEQ